MSRQEGRIIRGVGGFYYVDTPEGVVECKARGRFRIRGGKPLVGDLVQWEKQSDGTGFVTDIAPRKNALIRPPVSNLDQLVIVLSQAPPQTDLFLVDKVIAIGESKGIEPILCINKWDLVPAEEWRQLYERAGFTVLPVSAQTGLGIDRLRACLAGKISAFTGNSAVGKSSLLNRLTGQASMPVGEMSKIQRGRHTTRHVELWPIDGGYIADTPGFSAFDTGQMDLVYKDQLPETFREFAPYLDRCRFTGCAHVKEKDCAVRRAVEEGAIAPSRYESYCKLYETVRQIPDWQKP